METLIYANEQIATFIAVFIHFCAVKKGKSSEKMKQMFVW